MGRANTEYKQPWITTANNKENENKWIVKMIDLVWFRSAYLEICWNSIQASEESIGKCLHMRWLYMDPKVMPLCLQTLTTAPE